MNARRAIPIGVLVASAAAAPWAILAAVLSPYATIPKTNPFRLQAAVTSPRPAEPTRPAPVPALSVEVTGLMSLGARRALLEITEAGKLVSRPVLAEGEVADGVEVVHIDLETCWVKARVRGVETLLPLGKGHLRGSEPSPGSRPR